MTHMQREELFVRPPESLAHEPRHRVIAHLPGPDEATAAVSALIDTGIPATEIFVVCGEEGARRIDPSGKHHGLKGRLVRAAETVFSAEDTIKEDTAHLDAGGVIISAPADDADERKRALHALRVHGGSDMRYYGATTWEDVG